MIVKKILYSISYPTQIYCIQSDHILNDCIKSDRMKSDWLKSDRCIKSDCYMKIDWTKSDRILIECTVLKRRQHAN